MSHINRPKTFSQAEPRSQALPAALKAAQSFNVFPTRQELQQDPQTENSTVICDSWAVPGRRKGRNMSPDSCPTISMQMLAAKVPYVFSLGCAVCHVVWSMHGFQSCTCKMLCSVARRGWQIEKNGKSLAQRSLLCEASLRLH